MPLCCIGNVSYAPRLQLITVGDSLTEYGARRHGWVSLLEESYVRRADVFNRGYAGYNTRVLRAAIRELQARDSWPSPRPQLKQLVTLFIGTNDASLSLEQMTEAWPQLKPLNNEHRLHVPLDEFELNLQEIISMLVPEFAEAVHHNTTLMSFPSSSIALILITPGQLDANAWKTRHMKPPFDLASIPDSRTLESARAYADAVLRVARRWAIPAIDLYELTAPTLDASSSSPSWHIFTDGLHFNDDGDRLIHDTLLEQISISFPSLSPQALLLDAPNYWQLDFTRVDHDMAPA